jgi:quinol monooxygenase YgiN
MKIGLCIVDGPERRDYTAAIDAAECGRGGNMKATYGFRATLTARPGKGDKLVEVLLTAATGTGPATSKNCVAFVVARSTTNKDVIYVTEGWTSKDRHAEVFASENAKALTAKITPLVDDAEYQDEVPVGGLLRNGAVS